MACMIKPSWFCSVVISSHGISISWWSFFLKNPHPNCIFLIKHISTLAGSTSSTFVSYFLGMKTYEHLWVLVPFWNFMKAYAYWFPFRLARCYIWCRLHLDIFLKIFQFLFLQEWWMVTKGFETMSNMCTSNHNQKDKTLHQGIQASMIYITIIVFLSLLMHVKVHFCLHLLLIEFAHDLQANKTTTFVFYLQRQRTVFVAFSHWKD